MRDIPLNCFFVSLPSAINTPRTVFLVTFINSKERGKIPTPNTNLKKESKKMTITNVCAKSIAIFSILLIHKSCFESTASTCVSFHACRNLKAPRLFMNTDFQVLAPFTTYYHLKALLNYITVSYFIFPSSSFSFFSTRF